MSYTPTNWKTGDKVTAEKLNNIEDGIVNNALPSVTPEDDGKVLGVENGAWTVINGGSGLPDYSAANDDDVLAITSGSPAWTAPGISGTEEWKADFRTLSFIFYEAISETAAECVIELPFATIICTASFGIDVETGDKSVSFTDWRLYDGEQLPEELMLYATRAQYTIRHDFFVADAIKPYGELTDWLPTVTVAPINIE